MQSRPRVKTGRPARFRRCPKCNKQIRVHQRRCKSCHLQLKV